MRNQPATLRQLVALLGDEYLDAELSVMVLDGYGNVAVVPLHLNPSDYPRRISNHPDEKATIRISTYLTGNRLVRTKA